MICFFLCILPAYEYINIERGVGWGGVVCYVWRRERLFFKGNVGPDRNLYMTLKQMSELMNKPKMTIEETEDESK